MNELREMMETPWATWGSLIFFLCGVAFLIRAVKVTRQVSKDAAEELRKKIELVDRMQQELMDKNDRRPETHKN